jgi:hypothetical protein
MDERPITLTDSGVTASTNSAEDEENKSVRKSRVNPNSRCIGGPTMYHLNNEAQSPNVACGILCWCDK